VNDYTFVIREFRFIFWAYNLIWIGLAAYLAYILVRMNKLSREVRRLTEDRAAPPRA
jgi:CcmD family protein